VNKPQDDRPPSRLTAGFHSRGALPHLKREGGSYFITFRLAGTLPAEVLQRFKTEREQLVAQALAAKHPLTWREQEEVFRWYCGRVDAYLDEGRGNCFLRQPAIAELISGALKFFLGQRYHLPAWVVMPNHVHAVVRPLPGHTLNDIEHSWKSFTANKANKLLQRTGRIFWQSECFDHLIRDDDDHARCCAYVVNNPVTARLCERPEVWRWSSAWRGA
jgi:REP element-mobilizing transposase RayT